MLGKTLLCFIKKNVLLEWQRVRQVDTAEMRLTMALFDCLHVLQDLLLFFVYFTVQNG